MTVSSRPQPGKRPPNRRALILEAATELFADRGFENVAMSDIADAVAVGPSALYRHFASKTELLVAAIAEVTGDVARLDESVDSVDAALRRLATYAVDHRLSGALWQRESRQLPPERRTPLRADLRRLRDRIADLVIRERPGLALDQARVLSVAAIAAVFSPAFHHTSIDRPGFETLLVQIAGRVIDVDVPMATAAVPQVSGVVPASRREAVLAAAMRLFAERTYATVGVEDIASAAGMAGSSVYLQFAGKTEILLAALQRGTGYLQLTLNETLASARSEDDALRQLVDIYARFAMRHPELVDALITEVRSLPREQAGELAADQRAYVGEWVQLYRRLRPEDDLSTATVVVQAALTVINDLARAPTFRTRGDAIEVAAKLARSALQLT